MSDYCFILAERNTGTGFIYISIDVRSLSENDNDMF